LTRKKLWSAISKGTTELRGCGDRGYVADLMLDDARLQHQIQAAMARLTTRLSELFEAELDRLARGARPKTRARAEKNRPAPTAVAESQQVADSPAAKRVPLSQRKNVFRVPSGAPLPPRGSQSAQPATPSAISRDQIKDAALKIVAQSASITPEQLRTKLNAALAPVIDRLVQDASEAES